MFRRLVSNLAFSPALVGQLGFYAKRLRQEEATRRVGLIFTALALVVQSFAVFSPPEPVNASSPSDFIRGGAKTKQDYLNHYDANTNNIRDLFTAIGITRANISSSTESQINSKGGYYSWGMVPHFSTSQGERSYTVKTSSGSLKTFYYHPLNLWDTGSNVRTGSYYNVLVGKTASGMWFALMHACGNLTLKVIPPPPPCPTGTTGTYPNCTVPPKKCTIPGKESLLATDPNCKVTPKCTVPGKENLPANDPNCKSDPIAACQNLQIQKNVSGYQFNAASSTANGAKVVSYTYVVKRDGKVVKTQTNTTGSLSDIYTYSTTQQGIYTVELTVKTSLGDKTSTSCVGTFTIPAPEKCAVNPSLLKTDPECQPCPGDSMLWIKDAKCTGSVLSTKTAKNITQGDVNATTVAAKASDQITYTLNVQNVGKAPIEVPLVEHLADVVEYATLSETGGGVYDSNAKSLTWPTVTLKPGEKQSRIFSVRMLSAIPAMNQGTSNKTSYDCKMTNTFGNAVDIAVECPVQKQFVEQTVAELPHTGPRENMIFAVVVFSIVVYFYARSRQLKKEVRLIRRDFNAGTI